MDLDIKYHPGKTNSRADALSHHPIPLLRANCAKTHTFPVMAAFEPVKVAQSGEPTPAHSLLGQRQQTDTQLWSIIQFLADGELPSDERHARQILLGQSAFTLLDGILYHIEDDKTLRVIPPECDNHQLFLEAHEGVFSGHLQQAKIHSRLSRHYWPGMQKDLDMWCRACVMCATRNLGRAVKPRLTPVPVGGPFEMVGVDVLQLPKTKHCNCYAMVFMDYLTKWPEVYATPDQTAPTIARLLVEEVLSCHGVPGRLLSDRGPSFLSRLVLGLSRS